MKDDHDPGTLDLEDAIARVGGRPRAIGAYIFAGGFTLGVLTHFDVDCVLEETKYGVATARLNMPEVPVRVGIENWGVETLAKEPWDFIYGNPPCSAWSSAGAATKKGRHWSSSSAVACTERHFNLLLELRPTFWAWESVRRVWEIGDDFVRDLARRAAEAGYSTTVLLHNAEWLGVPQRRKRFFMVCHRLAFEPRPPTFDPAKTIEEAIDGLNDPGDPLERNLGKFRAIIRETKQGENLSSAWMRLTSPDNRVHGDHGQMVGRPPFTIKRARSNKPAPVVMHELIHPTQDRGLSIKELAILCGYPPSYEFVDARDACQVGRGVCPPVGEWLAGEVVSAIKKNRAEASPTFKLVDYTDPPGSRAELSFDAESSSPALSVKGEEDVQESAKTEAIVAPSPRPDLLVADVRPKPGLKSGAYIRLLLSMGKHAPAQIVDLVRKHYPTSKATAKDVSYHVYKMKRESIQLPTFRQPTRAGERLSNDPDRSFDKSSLRASAHGKWVHRDYGAHFFRWGFAGRFVDGETEILDVGCGPDVPMIDVLTMPRSSVPKRYVGVDMNRQPRKCPQRQWATLHWEFNFIEDGHRLGQFDLVTCFEVIEHMRKEDGERLLVEICKAMRDDATFLLSTPVFNGKAAADHIHEWTVPELTGAIESAGLRVDRRHGTFASWNDVKKVASAAAELDVARRLSEYYSGEVMSCFLAPLYPDASRNCVWVLRRAP